MRRFSFKIDLMIMNTNLRCLLACVAILSTGSGLRADSLDASRAPARITEAAPPKAKPFSLHDVRVLDGPFKQGQNIAAKYLLSLEPDRFLANFRKEAGLKPKAEHYSGWEQQGVSGHSGGHYLSACAQAWAATGDERFLARVNYIVDELAECQQAQGDG